MRGKKRLLMFILLVAFALTACDKFATKDNSTSPTTISPQTVRTTSGTTAVQQSPDYYDSLRPWYNVGCNKQLRGTPVVCALFMDDDNSSWTASAIQLFLKNELAPAIAFLENEAQKWGVDLGLTVQPFATALEQGTTLKYNGTVNQNLRKDPSTKDALIQAATAFDCDSEEALKETMSQTYGEDEIIFLCIFNKDGTSYARNQLRDADVDGVEEIVLFAYPLDYPRWLVKKGERASVIAHEMLHVFGAQDFYTPSSRETLAKRYYPNDIMLWQYADIQKNTLGDHVAFSLGWTHTPPAVCYDENWQ